jgi:hypothetical protein
MLKGMIGLAAAVGAALALLGGPATAGACEPSTAHAAHVPAARPACP